MTGGMALRRMSLHLLRLREYGSFFFFYMYLLRPDQVYYMLL